MKRGLCLLLILVCNISLLTPITTKANDLSNATTKTIQDNSEMDYVINRVKSFLTKENTVGSINLTEKINVLNSNENMSVYFIISANELVGKVIVTKINNQYSAIIDTSNMSQINADYVNNIPISIYSIDNTIIVDNKVNSYVIFGDQKTILPPSAHKKSDKMYIIKDSKITVTSISTRSIYYSLNPPIIANTTINGKGMCGIAVTVSKINYQTSSNTTINSLYNLYKANYPNSPFGTYTEVYSFLYNYYNMQMNYHVGMAGKTEISTALASNRPLEMIITNSDSSKVHSILLCGIDEDASYYEFKIMDPNATSYVYFSVPNNYFSNPSSFYYSGYTIWRETRF